MRLWTSQPPCVAYMLRRGMAFRCDAGKATYAGDFDDAYDWLASEMSHRVGPAPDGVRWPVWAWRRYGRPDGEAPDVADDIVGSEDMDFFLIELDVQEDRVLLSDFDNWHTVLNGWMALDPDELLLPADERERLTDERVGAWMSADASDPAYRAAARGSWGNVFDVRHIETPEGDDWNGRYVQATLWEIRPEDVVGMAHVVTHADPVSRALREHNDDDSMDMGWYGLVADGDFRAAGIEVTPEWEARRHAAEARAMDEAERDGNGDDWRSYVPSIVAFDVLSDTTDGGISGGWCEVD